ncbi:MAG: hypothetical protein ABUT20_36720 [Bacteroidota bacterium]
MDIFEYLKQPHPWLNTGNYTITQILLFFTGSILWLVCYADTLIDIRNKKTLNIPLAAIVLNFGWEIAACWFFVPDMGKLLVVAYWAWMCFDVFIFANTFRYGYKQLINSFFKSRLKFFLAVGIVISFATQVTYMLQYDLPMAPITGYIINLVMSVSFLYLIIIPGYEGNSFVTGWCKFLGTGIISIMFFSKYPENHFLTSMYIAVAFFDVLYLVLLHRKRASVSAPANT